MKNLIILLRCTPWISGLISEGGGNREAAVQGAPTALVAGWVVVSATDQVGEGERSCVPIWMCSA